METATFITKPKGFKGDARLFRLSKPLKGNEHVVVSAVDASDTGPETYIFGTDSEGKVTDWGELPGSFKGSFDHEKALKDAGYKIIE